MKNKKNEKRLYFVKMRLDFQISYQNWPGNTWIYRTHYYLGVKFGLNVQIDGDNVGLYLKVSDFPPSKDKMDIKCTFGIVNDNGNICRKKTFEKIFVKSELPQSWGFNNWLKTNQIHPYVVNNNLTFCVTIDNASFTNEHTNLLLSQIHQAICSDKTKVVNEALLEENRILHQTHQALEKEIEELRTQIVQIQQQRDSGDLNPMNTVASSEILKEPLLETPSKKQKIQEKTTIEMLHGIVFDEYNMQELLKLSSCLMETHTNLQQHLQDSSTCCICMDNQIDSIFTCGHRTCAECAKKVQNCPVCKKSIDKVIKIF